MSTVDPTRKKSHAHYTPADKTGHVYERTSDDAGNDTYKEKRPEGQKQSPGGDYWEYGGDSIEPENGHS
ncbi:hypothetical protein PSFL111601_13295 [Pseudomonas floridensis]